MRKRPMTRALTLAMTLLAVVAAPASAQLEVAYQVFEDFAKDGRIDPCKHSSETLRNVQKHIPPDIEQYAPDYPAAVAAALEARARGVCSGEKTQPLPVVTPAAPTPRATPVPTAVPTKTVVPEPPQPETAPVAAGTPKPVAQPDVALRRVATATPANGAPAPVLLLALLAGLLALSGLLILGTRRFGWGEERLAGPRHAWAEAAWRAGGLWQDFRDWVRIGR